MIQCSTCEWNPDGGIHWACTCGHMWNTFETKAKCPKCNMQWTDTWCPACGKPTPHKDWYKTKEDLERIENSGDRALRAKKKKLESSLIGYGIKNYRVTHLPYLDHTKEKFHSSYDAGCRMIILYTCGYLVHNLEERWRLTEWLNNENLWNKVSPKEKDFLSATLPDKNTLMELSWGSEGALVLGWCLNKVSILPPLDIKNNDDAFAEFQSNVPEFGGPLFPFLNELKFRSFEEIYHETLLNEIVTSYFRDLLFNKQNDVTKINRSISYERHKTLNWLRTFYEGENEVTGDLWDDVDTST